MGDRANIHVIEERGGELYFYTHWSGMELPETLADALDRCRDRWGDESYLARGIFCEMVKDDVLGLTSYGVSTYQTDENYPDLVVRMSDKTVQDREGAIYSFDEYVQKYKQPASEPATLEEAMGKDPFHNDAGAQLIRDTLNDRGFKDVEQRMLLATAPGGRVA